VTFSSSNSLDGISRSEIFCEATSEEVSAACERANQVFAEFSQLPNASRGQFLQCIAELLQLQKENLEPIYCAESGLSPDRFESELLRTVRQLCNFAELSESGVWRNVSIDTSNPNQHPPKPDLRKMSIPIGPVVVFGASNFPLAYSTIGGDAAAALAVGCPVIVKAHPLHAATSDFVAALVVQAAKESGMPDGVFSHLHAQDVRVGTELVQHPLVKAVGFTGSHAGGRALFDLANKRKEPIPVFAEMGSVNPVFILPEFLQKEKAKSAEMLANSMISGLGQFCTNPGLIFVIDNEDTDEFLQVLSSAFLSKGSTSMLHSTIKDRFDQGKLQMEIHGAELHQSHGDMLDNFARQALGIIGAKQFIQNSKFQEEVFGPFTLIVRCADVYDFDSCIEVLHGQLSATILGSRDEISLHNQLVIKLQNKVGRIIFNGVPTGVDISPSMQHGGPYPASTDSRYGAVGIDSAQRFIRPLAYQDCPEDLLPEPLKNENLLNIVRRVNGFWTSDAINF
jgi:alpha-ketoglutaric semialdehyde dehydrogenase